MAAGTDGDFLRAVEWELERARRLFPEQSREITLIALGEELGELMQAHLKGEDEPSFYKEAVQVAVMALRCALDTRRS